MFNQAIESDNKSCLFIWLKVRTHITHNHNCPKLLLVIEVHKVLKLVVTSYGCKPGMLQLCEEQLNYIAMDFAWFVRLIGRVVLKKKNC